VNLGIVSSRLKVDPPSGPDHVAAIFAAAHGLGLGHVDLPGILAHLARHGPRGGDLMLTMEVPPATVDASIAYARRALAAYL
jgi:hypothetical protein